MFGSLREMLAEYPEIFKYGYSRFINEVNNNTRKKITSELADTERSYVKSLGTMINVSLSSFLTLGSLSSTHY